MHNICLWVNVSKSIGVGRGGGGGGGGQAPQLFERGGGATYPLAPPIIHPHFPSISMWNRKNYKCAKLKGKIIKNVILVWFEGAEKTIPFNSVLEFSILSDFKMRNTDLLKT